MSGYRNFIQEKINTTVNDGKYNHAMVCRALGEKYKGLLQCGTPLSITFKDSKKFGAIALLYSPPAPPPPPPFFY